MVKRVSQLERELEQLNKVTARQDALREARYERFGTRPQVPLVTVRPGINSDTGQRFWRVLDGDGDIITGMVTVPRTEWITRRIKDGDLEELTAEEAAQVANDEAEAAAAAAAAEEEANKPPAGEQPPGEQPPPTQPPEGGPPPEGATQPQPEPPLTTEAQAQAQTEAQPAPQPAQQPAPAASMRRRSAA